MSEMEGFASLTANEAPVGETTVVPLVVPQKAVVLTYQPQSQSPWDLEADEDRRQCRAVASSGDNMYGISLFFCVVCCLCGSPLTLACFIPAIMLATKVRKLAADGYGDRAQKALFAARILVVVGILAGIVIVVLSVVMKVVEYLNSSSSQDENNNN